MIVALFHAALSFGLGLGFGYVHFMSLKQVTRLLLDTGPVWWVIAIQLARLAALAALMVMLAILDSGALIAGALGVLLAREMVLRRVRKAE